MEGQIINAIQIALSGSSDQKLQLQAYEFLNEVKATKDGYNTALDLISKSTTSEINADLKFFLYQVIEENVENLTRDECHQLCQVVLRMLSEFVAHDIKDPAYLRNKFAQIHAKVFTMVYIDIYPNYINDLLELISSGNQLAVDYYARILNNIHSEVGDKYIARSQAWVDRNVMIKDALRDKNMNDLVASWFKVLTGSGNSEEILDNTLNIIGSYVDWMDIALFVTPQCINTIVGYLTRKQERNTTCNTLIQILSKKMPPEDKVELISILNLTNIISSIDLSGDVEFEEHVAKLSNQIGEELLYVLGNEPTLINQINEHLYTLWPIILTFLSHEYDDVSQNVFPFIQMFLSACKKNASLFSIELLSTLLNKIILKMKYDDDDDGDDEDEDSERQFTEFRARLKLFQDQIAGLAPDLYIEAIPVVINESLFEGGKSWNKLELGLFELSNFSESLKMNLINVPKNKLNESKPFMIFQEFLIKLIDSSFILEVNNPHIQSSFFELVVKHYSFLNSHENRRDLVLRILEIFTSPLGLFNDNEKVRLRSWYLFFRFMKLTKPKLNNEQLIEQIVLKLRPLLVIKAELPTRDEDDDVVENGNFNNQQYLFETIGLIISLVPHEYTSLKVKLIDSVFQPIFSDLEKCISIQDKEPIIVLQAHHSLMALGTIVRGYDYESNLKYPPEVVEKVNNAAQVVLITLENFSKFETIRDASRFAFARFVPLLSSAVISGHLTKLITIIWSSPNLKINEISDFMSFLGQIGHTYKSDDNIYQLLNNFFTPLFSKVFQTLDQQITEDENLRPDIIRDKNFLKKSLLNFLNSIIINHLSSLLVTETNKNEFPTIVSKLFEYSYDLSDTGASKLAIVQLINLVNVFGDGGKITDDKDLYGQSLPAIEGIDEFLMEKVVQLSFELPFQRQEFVLGDAQYRLIAQDIAMLLKTYQQKKGESFIKFLGTYLTNMGLSQDLLNDFCSNLINLDIKDFKKYFVSFVNQMKGSK
ncbi:LOS1 [Candida margitis]|uniref:LOS1 n=1 Tax=Candida margitis TaxID=1775924 RepID=UPI002226190B|nr:LOS1 [Candida margitis]KAI5970796.1 LOS1 [Candida margitis]